MKVHWWHIIMGSSRKTFQIKLQKVMFFRDLLSFIINILWRSPIITSIQYNKIWKISLIWYRHERNMIQKYGKRTILTNFISINIQFLRNINFGFVDTNQRDFIYKIERKDFCNKRHGFIHITYDFLRLQNSIHFIWQIYFYVIKPFFVFIFFIFIFFEKWLSRPVYVCLTNKMIVFYLCSSFPCITNWLIVVLFRMKIYTKP